MSVTFPFGLLYSDPWINIRNLQDIRHLRSDAEYSYNNRAIYIPYLANKLEYINQFNQTDFSKRKYFLVALCSPAASQDYRYRMNIYNIWKNHTLNINNQSIIELKMNGNDFYNSYFNSDYCIIIPGDTTSTLKLYKAIFSGCIPIIFISFYESLPFYNYINYSLFSIIIIKDIINNNNLMNELLLLMHNIRNNETLLSFYKQNLIYAIKLFDYSNIYSFPNLYLLTLLDLQRTNGCSHNRNTHKSHHSTYSAHSNSHSSNSNSNIVHENLIKKLEFQSLNNLTLLKRYKC